MWQLLPTASLVSGKNITLSLCFNPTALTVSLNIIWLSAAFSASSYESSVYPNS